LFSALIQQKEGGEYPSRVVGTALEHIRYKYHAISFALKETISYKKDKRSTKSKKNVVVSKSRPDGGHNAVERCFRVFERRDFLAIPGRAPGGQVHRPGVGNRRGYVGKVDRIFWRPVEQRGGQPQAPQDIVHGMPTGNNNLSVPYGVLAADQGPVGSLRVGRLLSKGPAGYVRRGSFHLSGIDSSPLAAVWIHGSPHFGNRDYGDANGPPFCSNLWHLLKGDSDEVNPHN